MKRVELAVLYGGRSDEHEVSLQSAGSVIRNLDSRRFSLTLIGISRDGRWYLQPESLVEAVKAGEAIEGVRTAPETRVCCTPVDGLSVGGAALELDCVFPVLHGSFGEDGTVQGLLELAGTAYVGSGVLGSALGMDKELVKYSWIARGLPVVPFLRVTAAELSELGRETLPDGLVERLVEHLGEHPYFVKPACAGSSVGIHRVESIGELSDALRDAFRFDTKALVEPSVDAREIEVAVLGNRRPRAFTPGEVIPTHTFYDYEAKYIDPDGARLVIPAELPDSTLETARKLAIEAFRASDAAGMARVDMFYDKRSEQLLLNEINTIPGFTRISMYPRMCTHDGLAYSELLSQLVDLALERHAERQALNADA